ncbi:MAG: ferredoxin--NADP reductase [Chryseolinea sp.]
MKLEIKHITKSTEDSVTITFTKPDSNFTYKPGQHGIFNFRFNDKLFSRTYSFNSAPLIDSDLSITVRAVEGGALSNLLIARQPDSVELEGVTGDFYIQTAPDKKRNLVMFAAGSGITPIISMIRAMLYQEPLSSISLIYSNRSFDRIIFREQLDQLAFDFSDRFKVYHVLTQESTVPEGFSVYYKDKLSKLVIKKLVKSIAADCDSPSEYYVCGPFSFMQLVEGVLQTLGIDKSKIFGEHFFIPSTEPEFNFASLAKRETIIQLKDEEKLLTVEPGMSILHAALANNIALAHSCTEGQCGVCRSLLLSGEVKLRRNHVLTEDELKQGQILLCQGFPISDNVAVRPLNKP